MLDDIKDVVLWIVAFFVGLISWIFRSSQSAQDRRITVLESDDRVMRAAALDLERSINESFEKVNRDDEQRHAEDRKSIKADFKAMEERNQRDHDQIVRRLDKLLNGG